MAPKLSLTLYESATLNLTLLRIPFVLLYTILFGRWSKRANGRPLNRVLNDEVTHFILSHLSVRQLHAASGSSVDSYTKWTKAKKVEPIVDDIGEDARLFWVGSRETENVIIYCHGGAFVAPLDDASVELWYRVQQGLLQKGLKVGVAILDYSVYPASFPTQLNQLLASIKHVLSLGVPQSKIFLAADSAGANIVIQLLGHILHPSSIVSQTPAPSTLTGFAGICLISPWTLPKNLIEADDSYDLISSKSVEVWANTYLSNVPESHITYVQPENASPAWFSGLDKIARRVQVTVGRNEVLYPAVMQFSETLDKAHGHVRLDVQEGGVHCDPIFDIAAKSTAPHPVEKQITEWFAETLTVA